MNSMQVKLSVEKTERGMYRQGLVRRDVQRIEAFLSYALQPWNTESTRLHDKALEALRELEELASQPETT